MNTRSNAEKKFHKLLKDVDLPGFAAFHSVNLSQHAYKQAGEIDFLLIGPEFILVLEIKGGRVERKDGVWLYTDRFGKEHRSSEGPFAQASSAMFALKKRLARELPAGVLNNSFPYGFACVFPDIFFETRSVEWDPEQVFDQRNTGSPAALEKAIRNLIKLKTDAAHGRHTLDQNALDRVRTLVRPDFDRLPSLTRRAEEIVAETVRLTESQNRYLDFSDLADHLLCSGGAGTGKTFLAAEVARREAAAGRTVTLTCKSEILASFLGMQIGMDSEKINVAPFSALAHLGQAEVLVVDEAQDLMNFKALEVLENALIGGFKGGRWRIFLDKNNQADVYGSFDREALDFLEDDDVLTAILPDNCRNTVEIISQVKHVLGADMGKGQTGNGPEVLWRWWKTPDEGAELLTDQINSLLDGGVDRDQITILCGGDPSNDPVLACLSGPVRKFVENLNSRTIVRLPQNRIGAAQIGLFKGLENNFVCVVSLPREEAEPMSSFSEADLYVAMTRAKAGLWLGLPIELLEPIGAIENMLQEAGDTHE